MEEDHRANNSFSTNTIIDTTKSDKPMWLTKVPVAAAKSWNLLSNAAAIGVGGGGVGAESYSMAKIVESFDFMRNGDESAKQYTMEMTGNENGNTTNSYILNEFQDFVPMTVFSETTQGKLAVEAFVEKKYDMKPHHRNLEEYHKMCRERTKKSMIKTRQIQVIDNDRGMHMRPMPGMLGLNPSSSKDKKKPAPLKQTEVKRTRRDRGELEDIMFKLFERQPNWALKQLVQETDQPAQFLKEILNELCNYNKRGANQGTYELKPEYKKSVDDMGDE